MKLKRWAKYLFIVGGALLGVLYIVWSGVNMYIIATDSASFVNGLSLVAWLVTTILLFIAVVIRIAKWWDDNAIGDELAEWFDCTFKEPDDE